MTLVILAAGLGSRYGGLKQLDAISENNETIIDFAIFDAIQVGFEKVVFVIRKEFSQQIKEIYIPRLQNKIAVSFVCQETNNIPKKFLPIKRTKPWGTAHALLTAKKEVDNNFCVINADDFYGKEAFKKMYSFLKNQPVNSYKFSMIGYLVKNTLSDNGSVSRGECIVNNKKELVQIHERKAIVKTQKEIVYNENNKEIPLDKSTIVSMNFWGFTPKIFSEIEHQFYTFLEKNSNNNEAEFYLPSVVNNLLESKKATVNVIKTTAIWMGVTYKNDKEKVVLGIKKMKEEGNYPQKLWS